MDTDKKVFLEEESISIHKFLENNYDFCPDDLVQKKKKHWRLKHQEILFLPNIVTVPLGFCLRYKDLVYQGKLIVVKDEFGKYGCYVNPRLVREIGIESDLSEYLGLNRDDKNQSIIMQELDQIKETKRIVTLFKKNEEIVLVNNLNNVYRRRNKNDKY